MLQATVLTLCIFPVEQKVFRGSQHSIAYQITESEACTGASGIVTYVISISQA